MTRRAYFITHPNVVISREVPVPQWPLSEIGRKRMKIGMQQPWWSEVTSIYCSGEQKAIDAAEIAATHLSLSAQIVEELHENDRSSTGFLPAEKFEQVADLFFAHPDESIRGWERAADAQQRIIAAVESILANDQTSGHIAIVSHGAVGALLYCHLAGHPISRQYDQPANGGGNVFSFEIATMKPDGWWQALDERL